MNNNIEEISQKINDLKSTLNDLHNQRKEMCPHNNVQKSGGGMWHDWPDYGYYPYVVKCLDCGVFADSDSDYRNIENRNMYKLLNSKVTIDKAKY